MAPYRNIYKARNSNPIYSNQLMSNTIFTSPWHTSGIQRISDARNTRQFMKTSISNPTKSEPFNNINAMSADEAGANPKEVLSKSDVEELQALYLELAQAERDFYSILDCEGLIDDPNALKGAFDSITDQEDKEALLDYYEHSFGERNGNLNKLHLLEEIGEWMGCSDMRVRQIENSALKKIRNNPENIRKLGSGNETFEKENVTEFEGPEDNYLSYSKYEGE